MGGGNEQEVQESLEGDRVGCGAPATAASAPPATTTGPRYTPCCASSEGRGRQQQPDAATLPHLVQQVQHEALLEHVDAHGGDEGRLLCRLRGQACAVDWGGQGWWSAMERETNKRGRAAVTAAILLLPLQPGAPSTVVSTRMRSKASPLGFSANSVMRPSPSIFIRPKSEARVASTGRQPMVTSAPVDRWCSTNCGADAGGGCVSEWGAAGGG